MLLRCRRFVWFVAEFLAICTLFFRSSASLGQTTGLNFTGSSNCNSADFETNIQFVNGPGDYYSIVFNKRNISSHPCTFDGALYGPTFYPDHVPGDPSFALCYDCENRLANGQYPIVPELTINPGKTARQTFRWKTTPKSSAVRCLKPDWMSGPALLSAPSLLKSVCSEIEVSRFSLNTSAEIAQTIAVAQDLMFELSSDRSKYYKGERFPVHVSLRARHPQAPAEQAVCPVLYLRERSPDGATRIDEVKPLAFKGCPSNILGVQLGDWNTGFELDSGANSRWDGFGEHAFQVFELAGSPDDAQVHLVSSNVLRIELADPARIHRTWGPRVKGIAADITLDKNTFRVGEDVSMHLAIENFDAETEVYGPSPVWDPCSIVGIEVQDSMGRPLSPGELLPSWSVCSGHGFGPQPYLKGEIVPLERGLRAEGWLPDGPGTYTLVVTWTPWAPSNNTSTGTPPTELKFYVTARATVTIHVVTDESH